MNVSTFARYSIACTVAGLLTIGCSETGPLTVPDQTTHEAEWGVVGSQRVDLIRGAWLGTLSWVEGHNLDLALYFGALTADPDDPDNPPVAVAAGYISLTGPQAQQEAARLPMSARVQDVGAGEYEVVVLGNVVTPSGVMIVMKLTGTLETNGPGLADDRVVNGEWLTGQSRGPWEAGHRDRRRIDAVLVDLDDPTTDFWVNSDAHTHQRIISEDNMEIHTLMSISTNVVSAFGRVVLPTGESRVLSPIENVWARDDVTEFHFFGAYEMEPLVGPYVFSALDATGEPIPGVTDSDFYLGGLCPDAPVGLAGTFEAGVGVAFTWSAVPKILGAFLDDGRGFYQLEIFRHFGDHGDVFGARFMQEAQVLLPWNGPLSEGMYGIPLSEFEPGQYRVKVLALSEAPQNDFGAKNAECAREDSRADLYFSIEDGGIDLP